MLNLVILSIMELDYSKTVEETSTLIELLPNKADKIEAFVSLEEFLEIQIDYSVASKLETIGDLACYVKSIYQQN